jgi:4-amino-4-deoxy-L-arabinose transferase-like glycosyltransferase
MIRSSKNPSDLSGLRTASDENIEARSMLQASPTSPDGGRFDSTVWWCWLFLTGHICLWTLVPGLTQPNAPLDVIEQLSWGHEWQFGYHKHPPLAAWIAELSCLATGRSVWPIYLAAQLCVGACFWAAWQLGRECLSPRLALCAVLVLEASYYYNFTTPELNNNVVSRTFWALSILFLYRAISRRQTAWWVLTGVSLALGMLSKYDTAVLVAVMLTFGLWHPASRPRWASSGPYLTLATALICFAPHLYWLWQHDFPTVTYFLNRSQSGGQLSEHLVNPAKFLGAQLMAVGPIGLMALPVLGGRWRCRSWTDSHLRLQRDFLLAMVLGPPGLILLASLVTGMHVRSMWGAALWTYAGVLILFLCPVEGNTKCLRRVVPVCLAISLVFAAGLSVRNVASPYLRGKGSRIHFPGRQLAVEVQRRWSARYAGSPRIVAGPMWLAGNIAFYGPRRASIYIDLDRRSSPWIDDDRLLREGGVVVWDLPRHQHAVPRRLSRRFPDVQWQPPIVLDWETGAELDKLEVGFALIPPRLENRPVAESPFPATAHRAIDEGHGS